MIFKFAPKNTLHKNHTIAMLGQSVQKHFARTPIRILNYLEKLEYQLLNSCFYYFCFRVKSTSIKAQQYQTGLRDKSSPINNAPQK